ncbi:MAG: GumC family protein [Pseudomonadota bacterium]
MQQPEHSYFATLVPVAAAPMPPPEPELGFVDHLITATAAIWARKYLVLGVMAGFVLLALIYVRVTTPLYTSITELLIDPRKKELIGQEVVPSGLGSSALGADTSLVDSQVSIIMSDSVTRRLVEKLSLEADPEFGGKSSSFGIGTLARTIVYGDAEKFSRSPYEEAQRKLDKRVKVKRKGNTYIIQIEARSADPHKAASISNGLAEIYVSESQLYSQRSTRAAASDIDARLEELRKASEKSARAVEDYRRQHGLIGAQNLLIVEQQLRDINDRLSEAQTAEKNAKAQLDEVQRAIANPLNAGLGVPQSTLSNNLLTRLAELSATESTLLTRFLPRHPRILALREQRRGLEEALNQELQRVLQRYETAYNVARESATSLQLEVDNLKNRAARSNTDSVRLRELQREADLSRQVYETFLARSKQVNQEVGLQNDNTRIISAGYPASRPSHPRAMLLLAAALMLGLIAGIGVAWLLHLVRGTVFPASQTTHHQPRYHGVWQ